MTHTTEVPVGAALKVKDMTRFPILAASATIVGASILVTGCASPASTPVASSDETRTITVAVQPAALFAPIYVALDEGFFEEEGLDVTTQTVATAAEIVPMVINGQVQFGAGSAPPVISAVSNNVDIKIVSTLSSSDAASAQILVPADSDIDSLTDLAGARVAVNAHSGLLELANVAAAENAGVDSSKIEFVPIAFGEMVPSLAAGQVDAITLAEPFISQSAGDNLKLISSPLVDGFGEVSAGSNVFASNQLIESDPDLVARFQRAMQKAVSYSAEHPEAVTSALVEHAGMTEEQVSAMAPIPFTSDTSEDSLAAMAGLMAELGWIERAPAVDDIVAAAP